MNAARDPSLRPIPGTAFAVTDAGMDGKDRSLIGIASGAAVTLNPLGAGKDFARLVAE